MRLSFILMAFLFAANPTYGGVISAVGFQSIDSTSTQNTNTSSDALIGWAFTATEDFMVLALGYYDDGQDGFVDSHEIGIWEINDVASTLLATTTIGPGTAGTLDGGFRYNTITPLQLEFATDYIIGATTGFGTGATEFDPTVVPSTTGFTSVQQITNVGNRFGSISPAGSGFNDTNFPSDFGNPFDPPNFGPNFLIAIPEPSCFLVMCCCVGWMACSRRRTA